jgi:hypothetical protein
LIEATGGPAAVRAENPFGHDVFSPRATPTP